MEYCHYCQSEVNFSTGAQAGVMPSLIFCCRSCEVIWNWSNTQKNILSEQGKLNLKQFEYLSSELTENKFRCSPDLRNFKFHIEGLNCISCVHLLEEIPQMISGVLLARLDLSESTLYVELDAHKNLAELCAQIVDMGYQPSILQSNDQLQKLQKLENRKELKKLAIAGAVAGNIMLFTVPLYGGLVGELATAFKWIVFIFFLPLLFYSSQSFYKNALVSLQKRMINVDVTIVVALWMGFLLSTWNLINQKDELYFDSTASFIFLILCSRFYMKKIQQKFLIKNILSHLFRKELYLDNLTQKNKTAEQLTVGDIVKINRDQIIPCDAELVNECVELDLTFLTGESWPEKKEKGMTIFAGSRVLTSECIIKVQNKSSESHLGQLVKKIELLSENSDVYKTETDKVAHWLTLVVLSIAGLFFIFYFQTNPWMAFQRSLALLIVACPCAIAFGTPLALSLGTQKAIQQGFFIRSESFFERLVNIKKIFLDKTGTLTESKLNLLKTFPPEIDKKMKAMILIAESQSRHPVAHSLRHAWQNIQNKNQTLDELELKSIKNIVGIGVEAEFNIDGQCLQLSVQKSSNQNSDSGLIEVVVLINQHKKAYLYFEEKLRDKTIDFVDQLYSLKKEVYILTGDIKARALEFSKQFKIPNFRIFFEQSPEMKEQVIKSNGPCIYIGDGLNDLLALKAAHVSYAIEGQFDVTLSVADVYAPGKGPEGILQLMSLSQKIQNTVHGNLFFALIYNLIAGGLALTGFMTPLLAALLMPISSSIILTHTIWRLK